MAPGEGYAERLQDAKDALERAIEVATRRAVRDKTRGRRSWQYRLQLHCGFAALSELLDQEH